MSTMYIWAQPQGNRTEYNFAILKTSRGKVKVHKGASMRVDNLGPKIFNGQTGGIQLADEEGRLEFVNGATQEVLVIAGETVGLDQVRPLRFGELLPFFEQVKESHRGFLR